MIAMSNFWRLFGVVIIAVVGGTLLAAATGSGGADADYSIMKLEAPEPQDARKEVEAAIEHFRRAMIERRPDWILADSASGLTFGHSNGVVQSREEFAEVVRSGTEIFKRIDISDRRLTISGDIAIELHHFSADIIYEGELVNFELEVVEVWQKTDRWRLIARQALKI